MSAEQMSFKAMIKRIANEEQIPAQVVLQNFMFERFFARLSKTAIRENLIVSRLCKMPVCREHRAA